MGGAVLPSHAYRIPIGGVSREQGERERVAGGTAAFGALPDKFSSGRGREVL